MTGPAVLVTGASGFIGSALCRQLALAGYKVRGAVRNDRADAGSGVELITMGSIDETTDWTGPLDGVSLVVHAAARVHITKEIDRDPLVAFRRVNVAGSERLIRQASQAGVARFVFLSSIGAEVAEHAAPTGPVPTPYQLSKLEAEKAIERVSQQANGPELVVVRPPMVYGPGAKGNFRRLLRVVDRGVPLPLASIRNRRSVVGLSNLCDLLQRCLERPEAAGECFLAADESLSTPALVRRIAGALGRPARLWPCPPALLRLAGRLTSRQATIARLTESLEVNADKAQRLLGWSPATSMTEELARTAKAWRGGQR